MSTLGKGRQESSLRIRATERHLGVGGGRRPKCQRRAKDGASSSSVRCRCAYNLAFPVTRGGSNVDLNTGADLIERLRAAGLRGRGGDVSPAGRSGGRCGRGWRGRRGRQRCRGRARLGQGQVVMLERPGRFSRVWAWPPRPWAHARRWSTQGAFAAAQAALEGALAKANLDGLEVRIHRGDDSYVSGEETALLEVLEGRRPGPPSASRRRWATRADRRWFRTWRHCRGPGRPGRPRRLTEPVRHPAHALGHVRRRASTKSAWARPLPRDRRVGSRCASDIGLVFPAGLGAPLAGDDLATRWTPRP